MRALPAGRHFFRGSDGYEAARRGTVWHRRVPDRYPEVIVQAVSADDIVSAIRYATVNGHPARHTESKRPLVVLFTTAREMTQITSRLPSRILSEFNVKITAARADQRPLWQVT